MLIVHVDIHVKPESVEAFRRASLENARNSVQEPGIARFDFLQDNDDPTHFVLIEVYRHPDAREQHRATPHYATWRDTVADMMAAPRSGVLFHNLFPGDEGW
jgi:autoinducer 2-degrading protein